jgi:thioredoxin-related protein
MIHCIVRRGIVLFQNEFMKYTIKLIIILILCLPFLTHAQEEKNGIQWSSNLTYKEVLEKAKKENKFIFLDCYTTWCGPCKWMDKDVYTNDTVGQFFNEKFVSVKVQMDQTNNDDTYVKSWYSTVKDFTTTYFIYSYPTYLFFSPEGKLLHKDIGFKEPAKFIAVASTAIEPGRAYIDPAAECVRMVEEWEKGEKKDYDQLPKMIQTARASDNSEVEMKLLKELGKYMLSLPKEVRYTKERIEIWKNVTFSSTSKTFSFFLNDARMIDDVMNEKGFSDKIVDRTIFEEISLPFLNEQNKNKDVSMSGRIPLAQGGISLSSYTAETDWKHLEKSITEKYNKAIAARNILSARIEWYKRNRNYYNFVKYGLKQFNKYPPAKYRSSIINDFAWNAFLYVEDKKLLNSVIRITGKVTKESPKAFLLFDTYGNLLYKAGRNIDAILWEEKALKAANDAGKKTIADGYMKTIEQMKKGEPTYGVKPLRN